MIRSIFYSRFHPERGPIVLHQVPDGAIIPAQQQAHKPLFEFANVADFIIPRQDFCDRLLTICVHRRRIIGFPVCIVDLDKYERNEFIFNFGLVVDENTDASAYIKVVTRVAKLLREVEEQSSFLSNDELQAAETEDEDSDDDPVHDTRGSRVYALCEMIMEDLNNYSECMVTVDEYNTFNTKLFPTPAPALPVKAWHVPLSIVDLHSLTDNNWDLTMLRVLPYIDGVNSVAIIAQLADADLSLTRQAIAHLVWYECVLLLDIFQFSAIYVPTPRIRQLLFDTETQDECARFAATVGSQVDRDTLRHLYCSLRPGLTLKAWCIEQCDHLSGIDVRKMIVMGVLKGFIYRVHRYAASLTKQDHGSQQRLRAPHAIESEQFDGATGIYEDEMDLDRYLDGLHCFDRICTDLRLSEKALMKRLKKDNDSYIIHR